MDSLTIRRTDDKEIFVYRWLLDAPRAIVQIAHGAAEHAVRYGRLAEALNGAGYAVYANDHRGHGRSAVEGRLGICAEADGWNRSVADLRCINSHIRGQHPGVPVILFGHSMGSLMTQQYLAEHGDTIAAAVLSGSTMIAGFAELLPVIEAELEQHGRDAPSPTMSAVMGDAMNAGIETPQTSHDWLSRDTAEVQKYLDDPFCGFDLSVGAVYDMLGDNRIPRSAEECAAIPTELPLYIFAGDRDPVSQNAEALYVLAQQYRDHGMASVTERYYPDGRHEMLNETNRDEVTADLIAWLDSLDL